MGLWQKDTVSRVTPTTVAPADPRKDPEVLAMIREMMVVEVGPLEMPTIATGMVGFVADGDGLWQIRRGPTVSEVVQVGKANLPFTQLGYVPGVALHAPLPLEMLEQVGSFFRWVFQTYKAEAFARIFWRIGEEGLEWDLVIPPQQVSGGGVKHETPSDQEGWIFWGDIHSHSSMSAFWSGTDDADEKRFSGSVFGVMGQWDKPWPQTKWRTHLGGRFVDLPLDQVLGGAKVAFSGNVPFGRVLDGSGKVEMFSHEASIFPPSGFPEEWKARVQENKGLRSHGYSSSDPSWGRGATLVGQRGGYTSPSTASSSRLPYRSDRQVSKLLRRIRNITSGVSTKGRSLFAQDPAKAIWFVDEHLEVWAKANASAPLVKVITPLKDLLQSNLQTPKGMFLLRKAEVVTGG